MRTLHTISAVFFNRASIYYIPTMLTFGSKDEAEAFIEDTFPIARREELTLECDDCESSESSGTKFIIEDTDEDWFVCDNGHASCP